MLHPPLTLAELVVPAVTVAVLAAVAMAPSWMLLTVTLLAAAHRLRLALPSPRRTLPSARRGGSRWAGGLRMAGQGRRGSGRGSP